MHAVTCIKQKLQAWLTLASLDRDRRKDLKQFVPDNSTRGHKNYSTQTLFFFHQIRSIQLAAKSSCHPVCVFSYFTKS